MTTKEVLKNLLEKLERFDAAECNSCGFCGSCATQWEGVQFRMAEARTHLDSMGQGLLGRIFDQSKVEKELEAARNDIEIKAGIIAKLEAQVGQDTELLRKQAAKIQDLTLLSKVDGDVFRQGRGEGRSDAHNELRRIIDPEDKYRFSWDGLMGQVKVLKNDVRAAFDRLKKYESAGINADDIIKKQQDATNRIKELEGRLQFAEERCDKKTDYNRRLDEENRALKKENKQLQELSKVVDLKRLEEENQGLNQVIRNQLKQKADFEGRIRERDKQVADLQDRLVGSPFDESKMKALEKHVKLQAARIEELQKQLTAAQEPPTWITSQGDALKPDEFDVTHLMNTIRLIERKGLDESKFAVIYRFLTAQARKCGVLLDMTEWQDVDAPEDRKKAYLERDLKRWQDAYTEQGKELTKVCEQRRELQKQNTSLREELGRLGTGASSGARSAQLIKENILLRGRLKKISELISLPKEK